MGEKNIVLCEIHTMRGIELHYFFWFKTRPIERTNSPMRGLQVFSKPSYSEISTMWGRPMLGLPVLQNISIYYVGTCIINSEKIYHEPKNITTASLPKVQQ